MGGTGRGDYCGGGGFGSAPLALPYSSYHFLYYRRGMRKKGEYRTESVNVYRIHTHVHSSKKFDCVTVEG